MWFVVASLRQIPLFVLGALLASALRRFHLRLLVGGDERFAAWFRSRTGSCALCAKRERAALRLPLRAALFRLPRRCPRCGGTGLRASRLVLDLGGGVLGVFIVGVYAPLVSALPQDAAPWILPAGGGFLLLSFLLLLFSALTEGVAGCVWNVSGGGSAFFAAAGMFLLGRMELLAPFCVAGWILHLAAALTSLVGEGDPAPAASAMLFALAPGGAARAGVFPADRLVLFVAAVLCSLLFGVLAAFLARGEKRGFLGTNIPLVPHLAAVAALLVLEGTLR